MPNVHTYSIHWHDFCLFCFWSSSRCTCIICTVNKRTQCVWTVLFWNIFSLFYFSFRVLYYSFYLYYIFVSVSAIHLIFVRRHLVLRARFAEWSSSLLYALYAPVFFLLFLSLFVLSLALKKWVTTQANYYLPEREREREIAHNLLTFKFIPIFLCCCGTLSIASFAPTERKMPGKMFVYVWYAIELLLRILHGTL